MQNRISELVCATEAQVTTKEELQDLTQQDSMEKTDSYHCFEVESLLALELTASVLGINSLF